MHKIETYDPPMCCPTGVSGTDVDPKLAQFAADLEWLMEKGVKVERYNLAQQPDKFANCKSTLWFCRRSLPAADPCNSKIVIRDSYDRLRTGS
jgi:hypothetical protein